jgi:hypothetical protein
MESVAVIVLALVVALVAIDAIARLDERRPRRRPPDDPAKQDKITVDLTKRS